MAGLDILPIMMGPIVALLVETAKRVPVIPFDGKGKAAMVAALTVSSLIVRIGLAYLQGDLISFDWAHELQIAYDAVTASLIAAGGYSLSRIEKSS